MLLNVALPVIVPLLDAPSVNTREFIPDIVVEFEEESVNKRFVITVLSPPLMVPETVPPQIIFPESVCVPPVDVLNVALPVISPMLYEVFKNVVLPITLAVLTVLLAKITPVVSAPPVSPDELIRNGSVVEVLIIGEVAPTSKASLVAPGIDPVFIEQLFDVYQLLTLFQSESTVPHQ